MRRHPAHRIADLEPDLAADAGIHLVEDERGHLIEPGENRRQREHHARHLATRGDAGQGAGFVAEVERDAELDRLGAVRARLRQRQERRREQAVVHAQLRQESVHLSRQAGRRRRASARELGRGLAQHRTRRGRAGLERGEVAARSIEQRQLCFRSAPGGDHVVERRAMLAHELEDDVAPTLNLGEARRVELDLRGVRGQFARHGFERVVTRVERLLQRRERAVDPDQ